VVGNIAGRVVGNIAGRLHPDPLIAARQAVTRKWWATAGAKYRLFVSELVLDECSAGDTAAAQERLEVIDDLDLLDTSDAVEELAEALVTHSAIPESQPRDAFHIAIAAVNRLEYLVT